MSCDSYLPLLSGHLDNQNSETEEKRLQAHLKTCKHCRALLAQLETNDALLCATTPEPPRELTQRIMAQVKQQPRKQPLRRKWISLSAGALAAAALLALVLLQSAPTAKQSRAKELSEPEAGAEATCTHDELSDFRSLPPELLSTANAQADLDEPPADNSFTQPPPVPTDAITSAVEAATEPSTQPATEPPAAEPYWNAEPDEPLEPTEPAKRKPSIVHGDRLAENTPLLVIWSAEAMSLPELSELTSTELPDAPAPPESLRQRFLAALPLMKKQLDQENPLAKITNYSISAYSADYPAFEQLLASLLGKFELALYYPAAERFESCTVLFIYATQEPLELPNS